MRDTENVRVIKTLSCMASTLIDWSQGVSNFPACYGCCLTYPGGRMSKEG